MYVKVAASLQTPPNSEKNEQRREGNDKISICENPKEKKKYACWCERDNCRHPRLHAYLYKLRRAKVFILHLLLLQLRGLQEQH